MLLVTCPWCGPRAETEFDCGGEGGIVRPAATETLSDAQWADYVFMRRNTKGLQHEQWRHSSGCGRWFNALRDSVSYRFAATWKVGEPQPQPQPQPQSHPQPHPQPQSPPHPQAQPSNDGPLS